jgi:hypothetical protein
MRIENALEKKQENHRRGAPVTIPTRPFLTQLSPEYTGLVQLVAKPVP